MRLVRCALGAPGIGVDDDFFESSGRSLLSVRVIVRLGHVLETRISVGALFELPTVAGLAEFIVEHLTSRQT